MDEVVPGLAPEVRGSAAGPERAPGVPSAAMAADPRWAQLAPPAAGFVAAQAAQAPPMQSRPVQAPPAPTAPAQAPSMQAPPVQAPPVQAPPMQAPVQAPSMQAPPMAPAPPAANRPVFELAPDTHGPDIGLAPDVVGTLPSVEVRISESRDTDYARQSTEDEVRTDDFSLPQALITMLEMRGSDLHLAAGAPPTVRVDGSLRGIPDTEPLTPEVIQRVMYALCTQQQRERFEETLELDFSYALKDVARFRVNMYKQRDSIGGAFRVIPYEIKSIEALGMPAVLNNFAALPRGFVLVTGPTGSGKSTTLAAMVDLANRTRDDHIMTVEDPIEFLHEHKRCLVNQREVGQDTYSFSNALKHVLRQDPDIILVGEMRDLETIQVALTAAETGHLVFATLHTQDAAQTVDRVIDVFPPSQQQQIRQQLAGTLQGIVCQTLCKTVDGRGRVAATEVLTATPAVRNLIREGKTHQIYSALQAGAQHG
ncbi:MAG: PilT/PilU family type 4a pilus ATPase, partial [Candidatus Nanopelagicales bacterium]|nr:PilT/PilU family type 4a pilus ATPase [Candidatus Nanopelagicales bacterium]